MIKSHIQKITQSPPTPTHPTHATRSRVSDSKQRIFKYRKLSQQSPTKSPDHQSNMAGGLRINKEMNLNDARTIRSDQFRNSYVSMNGQINTTFIDRLEEPKEVTANSNCLVRNPHGLPHTPTPVYGLRSSNHSNHKYSRESHLTPVKFSYNNPNHIQNQPKIGYHSNNQRVNPTAAYPHPQLPLPLPLPYNIASSMHTGSTNASSSIFPINKYPDSAYTTIIKPPPQQVNGNITNQQPPHPTHWRPVPQPTILQPAVSYPINQQPILYSTHYPQPHLLTIQHPIQYNQQPIQYNQQPIQYNQQQNNNTHKQNCKNIANLNYATNLTNNPGDCYKNKFIQLNSNTNAHTKNNSHPRYFDSSIKLPVKKIDTHNAVREVSSTNKQPQQLYETWNIKTQAKNINTNANTNTNTNTYTNTNTNTNTNINNGNSNTINNKPNFLTFQQIVNQGIQKQLDNSITPPALREENQPDQFSISTIRESKQLLNQSYSDLQLSNCPVTIPTSPTPPTRIIQPNKPNKPAAAAQFRLGDMAPIWMLIGLGVVLLVYQICR